MNQTKLNDSLEKLKNDMGGALKYFSIVSIRTGQSLIGYNEDPQKDAFYARATLEISKVVDINEYTIVEYSTGDVAVTLHTPDSTTIIEFDPKKILIGMFLNVVLPETRKNFLEALSA